MLTNCVCGCSGKLEAFDNRGRPRIMILGHNNKNKSLNQSHKEKIRQSHLGQKHSIETKTKMSLIKKGHWKNPEYQKKIPHQGMLGKTLSVEVKEKLRKLNLGSLNPRYGKDVPNAKRTYYKGIAFKSTWEAIFAKWLDLNNYIWQYEPKRFLFDGFSYLPDFFVKEFNSYVEIKGFWRDGDREKVNAFISSGENLLIIENIRSYEWKNKIDKFGDGK